MAEGNARLGTTALGVGSVEASSGEYIAEFSVLFAAAGNAERNEHMRPWVDRDEGPYLIPDDGQVGTPCFQFVRGLRKVVRPWSGEADRLRGLAEATALHLEDGADKRRSRF